MSKNCVCLYVYELHQNQKKEEVMQNAVILKRFGLVYQKSTYKEHLKLMILVPFLTQN